MSFYLDTSFIVSAFSKETRSQIALNWLSDHHDIELQTSGWVATEFASAIGLKILTGQFDGGDLHTLEAQWVQFKASRLSSIMIEDTDYELAAHMIYRSATGLRSGDALHLAICQRVQAKIVTFDQGLKSAADQFDIAAIIP